MIYVLFFLVLMLSVLIFVVAMDYFEFLNIIKFYTKKYPDVWTEAEVKIARRAIRHAFFKDGRFIHFLLVRSSMAYRISVNRELGGR